MKELRPAADGVYIDLNLIANNRYDLMTNDPTHDITGHNTPSAAGKKKHFFITKKS